MMKGKCQAQVFLLLSTEGVIAVKSIAAGRR